MDEQCIARKPSATMQRKTFIILGVAGVLQDLREQKQQKQAA